MADATCAPCAASPSGTCPAHVDPYTRAVERLLAMLAARGYTAADVDSLAALADLGRPGKCVAATPPAGAETNDPSRKKRTREKQGQRMRTAAAVDHGWREVALLRRTPEALR